ncbi:unnamed protein product [Rangifer tarandus platyrhynchus]|uniref:Uncharacterized protein n=2 Tax=Rangifer tarandus platyrhynchus TaxID=3082113 RepID=A0ABN8YZD7_RANTA|nr:unnamed protein product [Rangifer tarandus platyrhynchus]
MCSRPSIRGDAVVKHTAAVNRSSSFNCNNPRTQKVHQSKSGMTDTCVHATRPRLSAHSRHEAPASCPAEQAGSRHCASHGDITQECKLQDIPAQKFRREIKWNQST